MKSKDILGISVSILIIIFVFSGFIFIAYNIVSLVAEARPFPDIPEIKYNEVGDRNIVLRVDDIQSFVWGDVQRMIIDDTLNRGYTMSLGVIPADLEDDREMSRFLINRRGDLEIALHGLDSEFDEFDSLEYEDALDRIDNGLDILSFVEPEVATFIPPNNGYSDGTLKALDEKGLGLSAGYWNSEYGFDATTYDWEEGRFPSYEEVLGDCEISLDEKGLCIIMIHPQDFVSDGEFDSEKYAHYLLLLDGIEDFDANIINFRDLWRAE